MSDNKYNFSLNNKIYKKYMNFKMNNINYNQTKEENKLKEEKEQKEYEDSLKQIEDLKEKNKQLIEKNKIAKSQLNEDLNGINLAIEETKLKIELEEIKNNNKKEEIKFINQRDIDIQKIKYEGNIKSKERENLLKIQALEKGNSIKLIQLKYECLKDKVYNDKEFDELIEIARKRKEELINDELENVMEERKEVENFEKSSKKKLENLKERNNLEIEKKRFELKNYKLAEYNKLLENKKKLYDNFKNKFSANQLSNEKLKNNEILKAKMYFDQQKNNLVIRERIFEQQKQNIHAFLKQLEINDDDYSKFLLNMLK